MTCHARCASPSAAIGHRGPDRAVRVLPPVLAHARHVARDVAGVRAAAVERRVEQLHEACLGAHQVRRDGIHGAAHPLVAADAREHRPALRDRVDAALGAVARAERRAVVEVGAPVPLRRPSRRSRAERPGRRARFRIAARTARRDAGAPAARTRAALRTGRSRARRFRRGPRARRDSCRRSSRRRPSAADRVRRSAARAATARRACSYRLAVSAARPGMSYYDSRAAPPVDRRGSPRPRRARRCRWSPARSGTARAAARGSRPRCACARRGPPADATSAERRPRTNCRLALNSRCSRSNRGRVWTSAIASCSWSRKPNAPPDW